MVAFALMPRLPRDFRHIELGGKRSVVELEGEGIRRKWAGPPILVSVLFPSVHHASEVGL